MSGGFFKGTSLEQDSRFADKQVKLMSKMTFPPEYEKKVDVNKVKLELIKPWIGSRIRDLLGFEDDVVVDLVFNTLERHSQQAAGAGKSGTSSTGLDPRELQINLTGFLEKSARPFVTELWNLLLSAQSSPTGIPQQLIDAKKAELLAAQQVAAAHAAVVRAAQGLPPLSAAAPAVPGKRASRFGPAPPDVSSILGVPPSAPAAISSANVAPGTAPSASSSSRYEKSRSRRRDSSRSRSRSPRRSSHRSSRRDHSRSRSPRHRRSSRSRSPRSRSRDRKSSSSRHSSRRDRSRRSRTRSRSHSRSRSRGRRERRRSDKDRPRDRSREHSRERKADAPATEDQAKEAPPVATTADVAPKQPERDEDDMDISSGQLPSAARSNA